ncbi:glycosyltransferase family 9 protein [Escherichia coli]|uniref:glycosyltransferase family 9 protein n=1 Tax=Escherichia coli TaxID=562 RepID=UPI003B96C80D
MYIISTLKKINKKRNLAQRLFFLNLRAKIFNVFRRKKIHFESVNKIAIWVGKGLGDAVLASGFISALRTAGYEVVVLTDKKNSCIFKNLIEVDNVIISDRDSIIENQYDLLIDPYDSSHKVASKIRMLLKMKPKLSIGFNSNLYDINIPYFEYNSHFTERYEKLITFLNADIQKSIEPVLNIQVEVENKVLDWIQNMANGKQIITFCPFASREIRSFSAKQCEIFLNELSMKDSFKIIMLGSAEQLAQIPESYSKLFVTDPFCSLTSSIAIIKYSDIVVSVDTLFVHISRVYNKKLYALYNNRVIDRLYENNFVFSPGYKKAIQFFTDEYTKTALGDDVSKFDIQKIITAINVESNSVENINK